MLGAKWTRPERDNDWKTFFSELLEKKDPVYPNSGNTLKRYKTKQPGPDFNPIHVSGKTDRDVAGPVNALLAIMEQPRAKLNTDRRHNNAETRALVVTTARWSPNSRSRRRDYLAIACWAILETYWVQGYRPWLFQHVQIARIIRQDLSALYKPFVYNDQLVLTPDGGTVPCNDFPWVDMLAPTQSETDPEVKISIDEVKKEVEVQAMWAQYDKELQKVLSDVERSTIAHNDLGPDNTLDSMVIRRLNALLRVSPST